MRLVMMGTGTFAEPTFTALLGSSHSVVGLVTQPDRPVGEKRGSTRQTGKGMTTIAGEHKVPVYQPESINTPEGVAQLQTWKPDLLVVAAYGQILSRDVLATAAQGGINVHASLLPKYRGAAPIAWAIYHGEKQTGVTIIKMSVQLDAGDILAQAEVDIEAEETAGELESRLGPVGGRLAVQVVEQIGAGKVAGTKQDKARVTKAPKLTKENGLIDWSKSARQVCNQVRAMQPWPTPYTFLHQATKERVRVIISRARPFVELSTPSAPPGTVITDQRFPGQMFVTAAAEASGRPELVEVLELQPGGKRAMSTSEFLRGHALADGDRFGPDDA